MKHFKHLTFEPQQCLRELDALENLLSRKAALKENQDIRPFFEKRLHLSAFIASYAAKIIMRYDRVAFQYPLYGDFTCDLVVGDSGKHAYCFVEFEDATPKSLFVRQAAKATREWSPRLDHGFSQIIDWFHKLDDMKKSDDFAARFGARSIAFAAILVVGRDRYLQPGERERLEWRSQNVTICSQTIQCVTLDGLLEDLRGRLQTFRLGAETRG